MTTTYQPTDRLSGPPPQPAAPNAFSAGLITVTDTDATAEANSEVRAADPDLGLGLELPSDLELTVHPSIAGPSADIHNYNHNPPSTAAADPDHRPAQSQPQSPSGRPTTPAANAPHHQEEQQQQPHQGRRGHHPNSNLHQQKDATSAAPTIAPTAPSDAPATTDLLTFADVSNSISTLPFAPNFQSSLPFTDRQGNGNTASTISTPTSFRPPSSSSNVQAQQPPSQPPVPASASASAVRKTSPGLAARLKALGFGTSSTASSPATPPISDRVGRLNETQLRQLDEKHQAASFRSVIVRRGRPWKGASATPPSPASSPKLAQDNEPLTEHFDSPGAEPVTPSATEIHSSPRFLPSPLSDADPNSYPSLPEIRLPEPLAMDTQKYRLPDHTNGNGTKATLETRREHIERETEPVQSPVDEKETPPPPPPPKETPPAVNEASDYVSGLSSYFTPSQNRPGSIYTLSRASFANQLAQLTSLQLPDADSLSSKVSAIPTAQLAAKALINAADQIRSWISKASEVISGLDSDDDVEWSAAGGREGLAEVESAIVRFGELINVYVSAIEELQARQDIANVSADDLKRAVSQMEIIVTEWAKIRNTLQVVRGQVEIAMEWEELWNNVLGDIQGEMEELSRLVFEMEERRHKSITAAANGESVDIGDLETIVEDTPPQASRLQLHSRLSIPAVPMSPGSPSNPSTPNLSQDDSSLLALFARMQPLRASLDFLPMRLSVFQTRAERSFPTACDELEMRREGLDATYKKLEKDAESLRKELGEDRWVIVFRGAGRQAQKMHESVERSLLKLQESIDADLQLSNPPALIKKLESYEAKKTHYGPAIERVLSIIDKGVKDRLTVNGEVLRLHADLETKWASLKEQTREMDGTVEELQVDRTSQQLRDSVSSMLSNDRSTLASGHETPGSSPPSSVIMSSIGLDPHPSGVTQSKIRSPSNMPSNRRHSSLPAPAGQNRKPMTSRMSTVPSASSTTPVSASKIQRPNSTLGHRPKWNGSTNSSGIDTGHNFKPLSLTTPSPYSKTTPSPHSRRTPLTQKSASAVTPSSTGGSRLPTFRSPLGRASSESPKIDETPSRTGHSRLSFRERLAAASPVPKLNQPRTSAQNLSASGSSNRRASYHPSRAASAMEETRTSRPASSLASSSQRSSVGPLNRMRRESSTGPGVTSRLPLRKQDTQPKDKRPIWRP